MTSKDIDERDEVQLAEILKVISDFKNTIISVLITSLLVAVVAYFLVPRIYELTVDVRPATQASLAQYTALKAAGAFPYDGASLFEQFVSYVKDFDILTEAVKKTDSDHSQVKDENEIEDFVRKKITFISDQKDPGLLVIEVRGVSSKYVNDLAREILSKANTEFAQQIEFEIQQKIDSDKDSIQYKVELIVNEITARRQTEENRIKDEVEKLTEQAKIARIVGSEQPFRILSLPGGGEESSDVSSSSEGSGASINIPFIMAEPTYLEGYVALEERIRQLLARKNNDPYVDNLRDLERQVLQLKSDKTAERTSRLLLQSGLGGPGRAPLVWYQLQSNETVKLFPRASIFASVAVFAGLALGVTIAFVRAAIRKE